MPSDTTAVNFGKISKLDSDISKQDIAAGIINLVGQTAARIATSVATTFNAKEIVVVGRSPSFNGLKNSLEQAASIMGFSPHFPEAENLVLGEPLHFHVKFGRNLLTENPPAP